MGFDWKGIIGTVAPGIAAMLGSPIAGVAVAGLCEVFGLTPSGDDDADTAQIEAALRQMTPEQAIALKTKEQELALAFKRAGIDIYKLEVEDRKSARAMFASTKSLTPPLLSGVVVCGWVALMITLFAVEIPLGSKEIILRALGTADAALTLVLAFWFGSSSGSRAKDEKQRGGK